MDSFDVVVIGGGVVGSAFAWKLAHYDIRTAVLDKASDVICGTSGRNSGVVHAAFNPPVGSLKALFNLAGKNMFPAYCRSLGVPFRRTGKLVVALEQSQVIDLENLIRRGQANGVDDLELISADQARDFIPGIRVAAAMLSPSSAITCPFTLTIAQAESAVKAGVEYRLGCEVSRIRPHGGRHLPDRYTLETSSGPVRTRTVINTAGLGAVALARTVGAKFPRYRPVRGEYLVLDREADRLLPMPLYPLPPAGGRSLGIHLTPTVDGTVLVGPSAEPIRQGEDTRSTAKVIRKLMGECAELLPSIDSTPVIHCFSGVRPSFGSGSDFIVDSPPGLPGLVNLLGIESPGLTAAPALARVVVEDLLIKNDAVGVSWKKQRKAPVPHKPLPRVRDISLKKWEALWMKNPDYGEIVCRCEKVTRAEVKHALENPLGVRNLMGLKVRCRVTAGRCQGGFCLLRVAGELERSGDGEASQATLSGTGSELFVGKTKSLIRGGQRREGDGV